MPPYNRDDLVGLVTLDRNVVKATPQATLTMSNEYSAQPEDSPGAGAVRFDLARERLRALLGNELAHVPLRQFLTPDDKHLPKGLLGHSLHKILMQTTARAILDTPGVGHTRLNRLLSVMERAIQNMEANQAHASVQPSPASEVGAATPLIIEAPNETNRGTAPADWHAWCKRIYLHRLDQRPIGAFAESLHELPRALWSAPLASLLDSLTLDTLGPLTRRKVEKVIARLGCFLEAADSDTYASVPELPRIRLIAAWVENGVSRGVPPTRADLVGGFCEPLLGQIEADFSADASVMCALALGIRSEPETLEAIGDRFGVTRERVRQQIEDAAEGLRVRWVDGASYLRRLLKLLDTPEAKPDARLLAARVAEELFDTTPASDVALSDRILAAWRAAGRQRLTPMTADRIGEWIARTMPGIATTSAVQLIQRNFPHCQHGGASVWFSDSETDSVLRWLYAKGEPARIDDHVIERLITHAAPTAHPTLEQLHANAHIANTSRNLAARVSRDPRFAQVDDRLWMPAESCGFCRVDGAWSVQLDALPRGRLPLVSLPVSFLAKFVVSGMLQKGIVDATAAGVHRFINELIGNLFGAELPRSVPPYVLADMLVAQGDGVIRHMRRRRLHWESATSGLQVWGKRRWVGHVVTEAGKPMTLAEVGAALRAYYQDYVDHVINQLHYHHYSITDDAGGPDKRVAFITHLGPGIPVIAVPINCQRNIDHANLSPGVSRVVTQLRAKLAAGKLNPQALRSTPWLADLVCGGA